jgi:23S rRNA (pseudouridine1915-N3)-methyltransferase
MKVVNEMWLIAVGKMRASAELDLLNRYMGRLRPALKIVEIAEARGSELEIARKEGAAILAALPPAAWIVALDETGVQIGSEALAENIRKWRDAAKPIAFVIGGANGLDEMVLSRANYRLSFGKLTWPHMLVRPLLAEQMFRVQCILDGHPYHRRGVGKD